jgi:Protein of unknown function (DUF1360)
MHYSFRFLLATLAVWRITHLLSHEDGPWDLTLRVRRILARGMLGKLLSCFYCLSIWVAMPFAWFLKGNYAETLVGWLALSGASVLLERATRQSFDLKIREEEEPWDVAAKR